MRFLSLPNVSRFTGVRVSGRPLQPLDGRRAAPDSNGCVNRETMAWREASAPLTCYLEEDEEGRTCPRFEEMNLASRSI